MPCVVRREFGVGVGVSLSVHSLPGLNDSPITSLRWSLGWMIPSAWPAHVLRHGTLPEVELFSELLSECGIQAGE